MTEISMIWCRRWGGPGSANRRSPRSAASGRSTRKVRPGLRRSGFWDHRAGSGRLREVTGIGLKRAERIIAGWADQKVMREIMLFLLATASALTSGADLQDLRRRRDPADLGKSVPPGPWHRLPHGGPDRNKARHREDRPDPGARPTLSTVMIVAA